jgi:hypothetical protein
MLTLLLATQYTKTPRTSKNYQSFFSFFISKVQGMCSGQLFLLMNGLGNEKHVLKTCICILHGRLFIQTDYLQNWLYFVDFSQKKRKLKPCYATQLLLLNMHPCRVFFGELRGICCWPSERTTSF